MTDRQPPADRKVPEGYKLVAVPVSSLKSAGNWRLVAREKRCRHGAGKGHKACGQPAVAEINRSTVYQVWFAYCADRMFGKWVEDGQIMTWILRPASPEGENQ